MLLTIENFLDKNEVTTIRKKVCDGEWLDGKLTAGGLATKNKSNQQLNDHNAQATELANYILKKLGNHGTFISATIPHRIHPPRFNRYRGGETYGIHVDAPIMSMPHSAEVIRSDISATLFLSDPESYAGGELVIETEFGAQEVKLSAGDLVLYPSSSLHQVLPVQSGERLAAIMWIQSMVQDPSKRSLLYDLDQSIQTLTQGDTNHSELMRLSSVYHNLVRRWAVV